MATRLKPCPHCHDAWMYVSNGDYYSGYESYGYRVECRCHWAWKQIGWQKAKEEAIEKWNRKVSENDG